MPLPKQQELFCQAYIGAKFNGTVAYRRAYPTCKSDATAAANASRLLANAKVRERIAELTLATAAAQGVTPARVLKELEFVAFQRAGAIYRPDGSLKSPDEWDEATAATIAGVETEEEVEVTAADDEQDPQPHGGTLKRKRGAQVAIRTNKVKRWDKVRALELFMKHFGLLKEDGPHPDRPQIDLTKLSDAQKRVLLAALRSAAGRPVA